MKYFLTGLCCLLLQQSAKNQEIIRQAEERRKEAEQKQKREELNESEAVRMQYERERQARLEQVRNPSWTWCGDSGSSIPISSLGKDLGLGSLKNEFVVN